MYVFHFPDVGEGIHEGRVVEWLVAEGDTVAVDQPLIKVETDKAIVELPSPEAGTVLKLHSAVGDTIFVGDGLVSIGAAGEDAGIAPVAKPAAAEGAVGSSPVVPPVVSESGTVGLRRPLATPRTRAFAREKGVDLATMTGTGPRGRITNEDVGRAAAGGQVEASTPAASAPARAPIAVQGIVEQTDGGEVERLPITHLRKTIATAMRQSKMTSAHVTHVDEADVTELVDMYRSLKPTAGEGEVPFSLLSFFVKALVTVLREHPIFNASADEEQQEIVLKKFYNIGIAVDTPEGLIVPVVKNADTKDMMTIAAEISDLAARARERRLSLDEIRGGTCTITNIGPLGGVFATPIINQPELAIVGLHAIKERPAVVDGEIAVRKQMYLSVSFDHRYIDGAQGARFMSDLVDLVSEPKKLMVRL